MQRTFEEVLRDIERELGMLSLKAGWELEQHGKKVASSAQALQIQVKELLIGLRKAENAAKALMYDIEKEAE